MEELDIVKLGKKSLQGIIALISRQFVLQLLSTITFLIISSVLLPADIGIFTAVIAMQRIISFLTDFGLGAALIQKKQELTREDMVTSFTIQSGITFIFCILVFALKDTITSYFDLSPSGERLLLALVFIIFISSFKTIPSILLERKIQFQKLVIPQIIESLVFNILLIILVLQGFRVDSYTIAFLVSAIVGLPLYYFISPWRIGIGINRTSLTHLKFGLQYQAKNVLATIKDDFLTVILIKFLSFTQIGYIGFAQKLAYMSYRYIVDSVTKVTFSSYARIQDNKELLQKAIEKSLFYISCVVFPLIIGTIIITPYIIEYFHRWQNKWEPAIFSIIFFSLTAAISSMSSILINALDSTGNVKTTLNLMTLWTVLTWILTPLLIFFFGFNGVAIASFIISLTIIYTIYLVKKIVYFHFVRSIYKPLTTSVMMGVFLFAGTKLLITDIFTLILMIVLSGALYLTIFYFMAKKELYELKKILFRKI